MSKIFGKPPLKKYERHFIYGHKIRANHFYPCPIIILTNTTPCPITRSASSLSPLPPKFTDGRSPAAAAMLKLRRPMIPCLQLSACSLSSSISSCGRRRRLSPLPSVSPPAAKRVPFVSSAHGVEWQDPYRWMADTGDPALTDYLVRENAYADAFMAGTAGLRRELVAEMKSRIPANITTPPERWGPWLVCESSSLKNIIFRF